MYVLLYKYNAIKNIHNLLLSNTLQMSLLNLVFWTLSQISLHTLVLLPSIGAPASSPTIEHNLCVVYTQIFKCPWLAVSPGVGVVVNASASHNTITAPEQTHSIAIDLSINSCGSFYKNYCSNIECLIIREVYRSPESIVLPIPLQISLFTSLYSILIIMAPWQAVL